MIHRSRSVFTLWPTVVATALIITACSSSKKDEGPEGATVSRLDRFMNKGFDRKSGKFDSSMRSQFDQKNFAADKKVKDRQFKAGSFSGEHEYNGKSEYKAGEFAQRDKKSRETGENFNGADKTPRESDKTFATQESNLGAQHARAGDKEFSQSDDAFKTRLVHDAAKSQKKNKKPLIIPREGAEGKSAYTDEEVRRLVNRN